VSAFDNCLPLPAVITKRREFRLIVLGFPLQNFSMYGSPEEKVSLRETLSG